MARTVSAFDATLARALNNAGGASVLVNGAVFKTVSETVKTGSGRFDSYTPPPNDFGLLISDCGVALMTPDDMKKRTRVFALRVIRLAESLPHTPLGNVIRN